MFENCILNGNVKEIVFDVETTGLDPFGEHTWLYRKRDGKIFKRYGAEIFAFGIGFAGKNKFLSFFIEMEDLKSFPEITLTLHNPKILKIGHNIKFDIQMALKSGIKICGPYWDTLAATRLTHDREYSHSLKHLGNLFLCKPTDAESKWDAELKTWLRRARSAYTREGYPKGMVNYSFVPEEIIIPYTLEDIFHTYILYSFTKEEIETIYKYPFQQEMKINEIARKMEEYGVKVDRKKCKNAVKQLGLEIGLLTHKIQQVSKRHGFLKFNPNSGKQLQLLLKNLGVTEEELTRKNKITADKKQLQKIIEKRDLPFLKNLLDLRTAVKLKSTYFQSILDKSKNEDEVLHCQLKPTDTATGRMACVEPNLQNIPRPNSARLAGIPTVRSVFIPRTHDVWNFYFDYSQIELRMFALFCQEKSMLKAFENGRDLHMETARLMLNEETAEARQKAKNLNFGVIYGMGIRELANQLGCSLPQAKMLMAKYNMKFPKIKKLVGKTQQMLYKNGYVEDMFGKRYHIPLERAYIAVNSLVQGSSASVLKTAIIQAQNYIDMLHNPKIRLLLPIHDELVIQIPKACRKEVVPMLKFAMEDIPQVLSFGVKLEVEIKYSTTNWEEKKEYKIWKVQSQKKVDEAAYNRLRSKIVEERIVKRLEWIR